MVRPVPAGDEEIEIVPGVGRLLQLVARGKADAVCFLEGGLDGGPIAVPVQVRLLDRGPEEDRHVEQRALGQEPLHVAHLAALHRLGDVLGDRGGQLAGLDALRDGPHGAVLDQLVGALVVDVRQGDAGGLVSLLEEDLERLLEAPGADEFEIDVVLAAVLVELVLAHPGDARGAGAEQHLDPSLAREVRPLGPQVDEQQRDVDRDAEDDQRVDERLLEHGGNV